MTIKSFIPKIVFDPELGKRQEIRIFLNEKNELPSISTIDDTYENLGISIEIGNGFYEDRATQYLFANIAQDKDKYDGLGEEWHFVLFSELTPENCVDYKAIKKAIIRLGYEA